MEAASPGKDTDLKQLSDLDAVPAGQDWWPSLRGRLDRVSDVRGIAAILIEGRERIFREAADLPGRERCRWLSALIDLVVRRMLEVACEDPDNPGLAGRAYRHLAVAATGGYGRRELAPYSDIDINFIASSEDDPDVDVVTRRMFRLIMDVFLAEAKMKVGYAFRLLSEAAALQHQSLTALLDARFVTGSRELFQSFQDELRRHLHPVAFIHDKVRERDLSIRRRGLSVYRVEPDIKEGEGGLRDVQLAGWLAQAAFGFGSETVWEDIRAHGLLTSAEVDRVGQVLDFYSRLRWDMHLDAGRQADVLTASRQEAAAASLGYTDTPDESGAERLMRQYYEAAGFVRSVAKKMMARARSQQLKLEPGLAAREGRLVLQNPEAFLNDPVAALRAFAYCQRYGLRLSLEAEDALRQCVSVRPAPLDDPEAARVMLMILRGQSGVADALVAMARTGVLQWYVPEFGRVMGLVPGDAAHEYTVGWHSLMVVRHCEHLGESGDEETRQIFAAIRHPELLFLFALTHDIGKGGPGDHSEKGALIARDIASRLGMDAESVERLEFLVRNHLLMSNTARLRDLNLRRTVEDFVNVVGDRDTLSMLYIFTISDVVSVGSSAWSEIQGRFLRELYYRAERALVSRAPLIDSEEDLDLYRSRVRRELSITNLPPEAVERHVAAMPAIYLLNTSPEEMASHIEFISRAEQGEICTDFRSEQGSDFTELTICVRDDPQPGLLSKIAGVLWALDINVHAAQVFTREQDQKIALDTLYVDFEGQQLPEFKKHDLHRELRRVLLGEQSLQQLLERRRKSLPARYSSRSVSILNDLSESHSVVDIRAPDQPGLLYRMTSAFARLGWDIHSARVSTWGNEARDSFYVTEAGRKVGSGPEGVEGAVRRLEEALRQV